MTGGLPTGRPGVKDYVLSSEPKEHKSFLSGYPTGRTGDRGDRKKFHVLKFLLPSSGRLRSRELQAVFQEIQIDA